MFFIYVILAFAVLLTFLYFWDRSAKKKGHQMRDPSQMGRLSKEGRQDARAMGPRGTSTGDISWTAHQRFIGGLGKHTERENDALDDPYLKTDQARSDG
jgi:hypothetical protein